MSDKPNTYDPNKARVVIGGKVIEPLDATFRTWKTDQQTDHGKIHAETIERKVLTRNPYTGAERDPRDIESDPFGTLIIAPGEELKAGKPCGSYRKG